LALIIWLPILVIALVGGGIYLHVHHDNQIKAGQRANENQSVESCEAAVHQQWDATIKADQAGGYTSSAYEDEQAEQTQLNQCQ